jgi:hypothetical protein
MLTDSIWSGKRVITDYNRGINHRSKRSTGARAAKNIL